VHKLPKIAQVPRGLFLNQKRAACSIYESGKMIYDILRDTTLNDYTFDYMETDAVMSNVPMKSYDFFVINWHNHTLPIPREILTRYATLKIAVVVEVSNNDYIPFTPEIFDAYMVIDPTKDRVKKFFPFPRPVISTSTLNLLDPKKLTFGSFGLFSDSFKEEKRFYEIVDAANNTGEECIVRINLPVATYTYTALESIVKYADFLKSRAKPKVEVIVTHNYFDRKGLIQWLSQHNINCFPYYRERPGLSAVTDQALSAGRAIMTTECNTFRHLHKYISHYPKQSYTELMSSTLPGVKQMQIEWSGEQFRYKFNNMLKELNLI